MDSISWIVTHDGFVDSIFNHLIGRGCYNIYKHGSKIETKWKWKYNYFVSISHLYFRRSLPIVFHGYRDINLLILVQSSHVIAVILPC